MFGFSRSTPLKGPPKTTKINQYYSNSLTQNKGASKKFRQEEISYLRVLRPRSITKIETYACSWLNHALWAPWIPDTLLAMGWTKMLNNFFHRPQALFLKSQKDKNL